jgi:hypothetical protein
MMDFGGEEGEEEGEQGFGDDLDDSLDSMIQGASKKVYKEFKDEADSEVDEKLDEQEEDEEMRDQLRIPSDIEGSQGDLDDMEEVDNENDVFDKHEHEILDENVAEGGDGEDFGETKAGMEKELEETIF